VVLRVLTDLSIVLPICAAISGALLLLPSFLALGCVIAGVALFQAGEHLRWRWAVVIGGILMFSGVLAWALIVTR